MTGVLSMTEGSILAVHVLLLLAKNPGVSMTVGEVTGSLTASHAHLSKVLQRLARAGLVRASRGRHGGYALAGPLSDLRLLDVLEAMEGRIRTDRCPSSGDSLGSKALTDFWDSIHALVLQRYEVRLSEIQGPASVRRPS